jgi:hypothetical protein
MTHHKHLIQIFRGGRRIGSGVRLTKYLVLTAAHCLGDDEEKRRRPITLRLPNGRRVGGEFKQFDLLSDMAVLKIVRNGDSIPPLPVIPVDFAEQGDPWAAAHRPPGNGGPLRGTVSQVSAIYQSTRDQVVNAHRLSHDGSYDDVRKFSGSPVDREKPGRPSAVLGLIVARPATTDAPPDTLFAGTIEEAVQRFDIFKIQLQDTGQPQSPSGPEPLYTVIPDPQAEALDRKRRSVPAELERAGVGSYVNLRWHHRP